MIKYEIYKNIAEVRKDAKIANGCTLDLPDNDAKIIESYDTLEEAREALKGLRADYSDYGKIIQVTEYFIRENEYDKDGNLVTLWGDVIEFAEGLSDLNDEIY